MRVLLTDLGKIISDGLAIGTITLNIDLDVKLENKVYNAIKELCEYSKISHIIHEYSENTLNNLNKYNLCTAIASKDTNSAYYYSKINCKKYENRIIIPDTYAHLNSYPISYEIKLSKILNSQFFTFI